MLGHTLHTDLLRLRSSNALENVNIKCSYTVYLVSNSVLLIPIDPHDNIKKVKIERILLSWLVQAKVLKEKYTIDFNFLAKLLMPKLNIPKRCVRSLYVHYMLSCIDSNQLYNKLLLSKLQCGHRFTNHNFLLI